MASTGSAFLSSLFSVQGKNVLITGGSRGIGYMIAKGYVSAGANVLITSRSEDVCQKAAEELSNISDEGSGTCDYFVSNVGTREGCDSLVEHLQSSSFLPRSQSSASRLDVLINNAGTSWGEPLERESAKNNNWGFDKVIDLNVKGMFYLTRACIPLLSSSAGSNYNDPARIINIGSVAGIIPQEAPTHAYDLSKAAVHHLTKKFAADLAPKNITVNCIAPGYIPTRMSAGLKTWGVDKEMIENSIPLKRMGNENDLVGACVYLSSQASSWCTGVILNVDGGTIGTTQIPLASLSPA